MPHSASERFVKTVSTEASFDKVLLTGSTTEQWYPLRQLIKVLGEQKISHVAQLVHPGYSPTTNTFHRDFVSQMREYAVGVTCGMVLNYVVAKFLEIPASGQLLVANKRMSPILNALGLRAGEHYIQYNASSYESVSRYVLHQAHRNEINAIRKNGNHLVNKFHTTVARAKQVDDMVYCISRQKMLGSDVKSCHIWKVPFDLPELDQTIMLQLTKAKLGL